jgi:hypothetical protein
MMMGGGAEFMKNGEVGRLDGRFRREAYGLLGGFCVIRVVKGILVFGVFGWSSEDNREVLREEGEEKIRRGELE